MSEQFIEIALGDLKPGDVIVLDGDARGRVTKVEQRSHMPPIFQDCFGRDGVSVHWDNIAGPDTGKPGVDREHRDTTVHKVVDDD